MHLIYSKLLDPTLRRSLSTQAKVSIAWYLEKRMSSPALLPMVLSSPCGTRGISQAWTVWTQKLVLFVHYWSWGVSRKTWWFCARSRKDAMPILPCSQVAAIAPYKCCDSSTNFRVMATKLIFETRMWPPVFLVQSFTARNCTAWLATLTMWRLSELLTLALYLFVTLQSSTMQWMNGWEIEWKKCFRTCLSLQKTNLDLHKVEICHLESVWWNQINSHSIFGRLKTPVLHLTTHFGFSLGLSQSTIFALQKWLGWNIGQVKNNTSSLCSVECWNFWN